MGRERSALGCCPGEWGSLHDQRKEEKRSKGGFEAVILRSVLCVVLRFELLTLHVEKSHQRGIFGLEDAKRIRNNY